MKSEMTFVMASLIMTVDLGRGRSKDVVLQEARERIAGIPAVYYPSKAEYLRKMKDAGAIVITDAPSVGPSPRAALQAWFRATKALLVSVLTPDRVSRSS